MARAKTNKLYRDFNRGLITEASYLTYPENASIDELNTVINRKGNRTRRFGMDYQTGYVLEDLEIDDTKIINEYVWYSVNEDSDYNFVCIQVGTVIHFYRLNVGVVSANKLPFTINLMSYAIAGKTEDDIKKEFAAFSSGSGYLFIAHRFIDPITVVFDKDANSLTVTPIIIQVRDLEGVDDGLENDAEPPDLTALHHYNLLNQGWIGGGGGGSTSSGTGDTSSYGTPPESTSDLSTNVE